MTVQHKICDLAELIKSRCKSFSLDMNGNLLDGFVVYLSANNIVAFENRCPHTGVPLNWQPDQFLDIEQRYIQCSMHGALFQMQDGLCVHGPCVDQKLTKINITFDNSGVWYVETA